MCALENAWGSLATYARRVLWYVCVGKRVGLACHLRSKGALVCVRWKTREARFFIRGMLGMCALGKAWDSLPSAACFEKVVGMYHLEMRGARSPPALEGCFGMYVLDKRVGLAPALEWCLVYVRWKTRGSRSQTAL